MSSSSGMRLGWSRRTPASSRPATKPTRTSEASGRRSILITANQPFSGWDNVFPDPGMTVAAIDRLVHHSTIFELNKVESYRGKQAARQQKIQRDNVKASRQRQSFKENDNHPQDPLP